ncbi:DUF6365 family protein [Gorillibacterium sp. sgz500922]|uniref:DUF6365 family protein n=1 Tax=Gorillibacterium sp. sgz500922 TaxID=3446694 RepID=UPI003F678741
MLSEISTGELTIGYEFGSRLPKDDYQVKFLVPGRYEQYLQDRGESYYLLNVQDGPLTNSLRFKEAMEAFQPDYFLLSDVFTTEYSRSWSGISMKTLREYGIPLIGIDEYEYLSTNYTPDYYGGVFEKLPPLLEDCQYVVRNCPINLPKNGEASPRTFYFSLYRDGLGLSDADKEAVRGRLELHPNEKVVFFASSSWESINFHNSPFLLMLMKWVPLLLQHYMREVNERLTLVHVGPKPWELIDNPQLRYRHFDQLAPSEFDALLLSSDLFLTINAVSVTLSKAIFGSVPCLLFQNLKHIDFAKLEGRLAQMPDWYAAMASEVKEAYPFRAGFFGWFQLLKSVLRDNSYTDTYVEVPLFKPDEAVRLMRSYLFEEENIQELKLRQRNYVRQTAALDTPQIIMEKIREKSG